MSLFALPLVLAPAFAEEPAATDEATLEKKVKAALVETIEMTSAGDLDGWIAKYCDPSRCSEAQARNEFKTYQLKQANLKAAKCMNADKEITVSQKNGEIASGKEVRWYIKCEGKQMPSGIRFRYDAEKDHVYFSHLGF
jgi:hypothetical protein